MKSASEVSKIVNVNEATLHYYNEAGILRPSDILENGYIYYSDSDIVQLKIITILREIGLPLQVISSVVNEEDFDQKKAIKVQKELLELKKKRIEYLIEHVSEEDMLESVDLEAGKWEHIWEEKYSAK